MPVLSIREYEHISAVSRGTVPVGEEPAVQVQSVSIGVGSSPSIAFHGRTRFVRLNCDVACSVEFGNAPVAVSGNGNMAAGQTEYFGIGPGAGKVAVIAQ